MRTIALLIFVLFAPVAMALDRVDDSRRLQLVIVGDESMPPATWVQTDPAFAKLREGIHVVVMSKTSKLYRERYANLISGTEPIVLFERPDGGIIYAADQSTLPTTAAGLYTALKEHYNLARNAKPAGDLLASQMDCPDGNCPVDRPSILPLLPRDTDGSGFDLLPFDEGRRPVRDAMSYGVWIGIATLCAVVLGFGGVLILCLIGLTFYFIRSTKKYV